MAQMAQKTELLTMTEQVGKLSGSASTIKRKRKFLDVATQTRGNITKATKEAHIGRRTFYNWMEQDPEFAALYEEIQESIIDLIVDRAYHFALGIPQLDDQGNFKGWKIKPDAGTLQLLLRTLGRSRGFSEKTSIELEANIPFIHASEAVKRLVEHAQIL